MTSPLNVRTESCNDDQGTQELYLNVAVCDILEAAFVVLTRAFDKLPDAPVSVSWWSDHPRSLYDYRPYEIRINAKVTLWSKCVYQFSHELCHVLANFDRCRGHKHKWFEESICEMASLYVLRRLSVVWRVNPPPTIIGAVQYASSYATYVDNFAAKYDVPPRGELDEWLASNIPAMEKNSTIRDLNAIVSLSLLDCFLKDSVLWREIGHLNLWNSHDDETFEDYLESWEEVLLKSSLNAGRVPAIMRDIFYP